jgi:hypothetical protein
VRQPTPTRLHQDHGLPFHRFRPWRLRRGAQDYITKPSRSKSQDKIDKASSLRRASDEAPSPPGLTWALIIPSPSGSSSVRFCEVDGNRFLFGRIRRSGLFGQNAGKNPVTSRYSLPFCEKR